MKSLFFGGIHPADGKKLSAGVACSSAVRPAQVTIPMQQHIGAECKPLVQAGDYVKLGQVVGDGEGLCAPVHASVSGRVIAVEPRSHVSGRDVPSVVIENDYQDSPDPSIQPREDYAALDAEEILGVIRRAGIVGMGGATFPASVKAMTSLGKIDTLIANACECEPYITSDDMLLRTFPEQVAGGMKIMGRMLAPERMVIAVEDNKGEAAKAIEPFIEKEGSMELLVLPARYPQGAEKQLVQAVTGREVPSGQLPASVGCAVFNVATYASIYRAVCLGMPVIERIVTVSGEGVRDPKNFTARIGTSFGELIRAAGGLREGACKVISGGPMMGYAQADLSAPVIKGTNSILCLPPQKNYSAVNPACIRCGRCVKACPARLQPLYIYRYAGKNSVEMLERYSAMDCIECGCCAYVCPGKLSLVEVIRGAKRSIKEAKK